MNDLAATFIRLAILQKADEIQLGAIPSADRLSKSEAQTEDTREYFCDHTEALKQAVDEMRAFAKTIKAED